VTVLNDDSSKSTSEQLDAESPTVSRTLMSAAVVSIALAHEYAFWNLFGVDVLEHVGFADLPRLAVWPIIAISGGFIGSLLLASFPAIVWAPFVGKEKEYAGRETVAERLLRRLRPPIALLLFLFGFVVLPLNFNAAWLLGTLAVAIASWMAFDLNRHLDQALPRDVVVLWVSFLCMAFGIGRHEAYGILSGDACLQVAFEGSKSNTLRYIGRAGDYLFLWDPEAHRTEIQRLEDVAPLRLSLGKDQCKKMRSIIAEL
jgi:hypothetical protein